MTSVGCRPALRTVNTPSRRSRAADAPGLAVTPEFTSRTTVLFSATVAEVPDKRRTTALPAFPVWMTSPPNSAAPGGAENSDAGDPSSHTGPVPIIVPTGFVLTARSPPKPGTLAPTSRANNVRLRCGKGPPSDADVKHLSRLHLKNRIVPFAREAVNQYLPRRAGFKREGTRGRVVCAAGLCPSNQKPTPVRP